MKRLDLTDKIIKKHPRGAIKRKDMERQEDKDNAQGGQCT